MHNFYSSLFAGTLVNKDTTSSASFTLHLELDSESILKIQKNFPHARCFPMSGDNIWTKCGESWYVGEFTKDSIGLFGFPTAYQFNPEPF